MTFASKVLCRVVTLLQRLPLVCSGSVGHGIARKKDSPARDYFAVDEDLKFVVCQACKEEGIRTAVGIACTSLLWADYTNLVQNLKDKHAQLHREFQQKIEVQNTANLSSSPAPFWQKASSLKVKIAYESVG